jgi:transposase
MARYKDHSYSQGIMIPIDLTKQIVPGTLEYTIHWLVENKINLSGIEKKYKNDITGAPAYNPKLLLKIVLLSYSRGIISSRKIMHACRENIVFRALSADSNPDFTTIASFIRTMKDEIKTIFTNVLLVCSELDVLGGTEFALDGCKMSSNASKEMSGTFSDLQKKKQKIEKTIVYLIEKHEKQDTDESNNETGNLGKNHERRIKRLQAKADKIEQFLTENRPKMKSRTGESQSNVTDNESAKMKTSHGVIQGYNGLALVDSRHQIIVHAEAFGSGHEHDLLQPMIEGAKETVTNAGLGDDYFKATRIIADTGSFREDNIKYLETEGVDAYIPDQQFRKRDPRFSSAVRHKGGQGKLFTKEDFEYNENENTFICPAGKKLKYSRDQRFGNTEGRCYISSKANCSACLLRTDCVRSEKTRYRTLYVIEKYFDRNYSDEMKKKIDTEEGREIYSRRMKIVEPVFGNIRSNKRLDRFTLRGKVKVNIQWVLYSIVHNIEKLTRYAVIESSI